MKKYNFYNVMKKIFVGILLILSTSYFVRSEENVCKILKCGSKVSFNPDIYRTVTETIRVYVKYADFVESATCNKLGINIAIGAKKRDNNPCETYVDLIISSENTSPMRLFDQGEISLFGNILGVKTLTTKFTIGIWSPPPKVDKFQILFNNMAALTNVYTHQTYRIIIQWSGIVNNYKLDENYYLIKHKLTFIKHYHFARGNNEYSSFKELISSYNYLINYFLIISSSSINQLFSDKISYKDSELENTSGIFYNRSEIEKNVFDIIKHTPLNDKKRLLFLELIQNDLKMNSGKNELSAFKNLRKIVFENYESLSNTLLLYYLKRLNVYCTIEIANGNYGLNKELFDNYRFMIEKKLFFLDGIPDLRLVDYRIILFTALKNNEIEWTEKFINESVGMIKEESRNNIINFGYAVLMFHKKNYSESLDHISMIKHELLPITIDIYVLKSKIFYEMGFFDTGKSVADSLRHFIKNNRVLSDVLKNSLKSFYTYFNTLLSLNNNFNEVKLNKLLSDIESSNGTWNKIWLTEKTNELLAVSGKSRHLKNNS